MKLKRSGIKFKGPAVKILAATIVIVSLVLVFYVSKQPYSEQLHEGDISLYDIYSPYDFSYQTGIDEELTDKKRIKAAQAVDEIFDRIDLKSKITAKLDFIFKEISHVNAMADISEEKRVDILQNEIKLPLSVTTYETLLHTQNLIKFSQTISDLSMLCLSKGILKGTDAKEIIQKGKITIRDLGIGQEEELDTHHLLDDLNLKASCAEIVKNYLKSNKLRDVACEILSATLAANLEQNPAETKLRRESAAKNIIPEYIYTDVKKNELVIEKGRRVTHDILLKLDELEKHRPKIKKASFIFGISILIILFTVIMALYLKFFEPRLLTVKIITLLGVIAVASAIISKIIVNSPLPNYITPLASGAMLITILISPTLAMMCAMPLAIFTGIIAGYKFNITVVFLAGCIVSVYALNKTKKRSQLLSAGLIAGTINFLIILGLGMLNDLNYKVYILEGFWGLCGGILSSFIVIGSLPLFEGFFDITTNISLLELSDLNHPLLKELFYKAPGTYHHSISVGNLAQSACEVISANPLLAKVGGYYHDIGKLKNPEYFSENQLTQKGRHEKLTPTMSRLIITNHVKDGVELAQKNKIKNDIMDFIKEHHGTGVIHYFYHKALEQTEDEKLLEEEGFRYSGPKPQTKERAVVLLADSIEAASRTLANPAPLAIKELVQRIINNKFIDGQFDECNLTLRDINNISDVFTRILTSMFHARVEYPTGNHKK